MKQHLRTILICATALIVCATAAVMLRYKTYNKEGAATAVYDRWTGVMTLCGKYGCYTEDELRTFAQAEAPPAAPEQKPDISIETPLGVNLIFKPGTSKAEIEKTVAELDACGGRATNASAFEKCYRPSVADQADGVGFRVNGSAIIPGSQISM